MKTLAILLVFLVVACVFTAQHPADADCNTKACWALCQREHGIYFRRAVCEGSRCKCILVNGR
uniref:Termicin n=1 Tax=Drepanotermes rubriceps TaxID=62950 RepID=Q5SDH7_9NEOP|nr:termicin [Drepanotermes rubriceps]